MEAHSTLKFFHVTFLCWHSAASIMDHPVHEYSFYLGDMRHAGGRVNREKGKEKGKGLLYTKQKMSLLVQML